MNQIMQGTQGPSAFVGWPFKDYLSCWLDLCAPNCYDATQSNFFSATYTAILLLLV